MSLGTVDRNGPWVADVIYVFDDNFNLYWMSRPNFRHSLAIKDNPKVAGAVTISQKPEEKDLGLQIEGEAQKLGKLEFDLIVKYLKKKGKLNPQKIIDVLLEGYSWYELKPNFIELIDQQNFGFDKQKIEFNT